jgi:hypothetical protein
LRYRSIQRTHNRRRLTPGYGVRGCSGGCWAQLTGPSGPA